MTTQDKSQKAFAAWYGDNPTEFSPLANRTTQQTLDVWVWQFWQAAEANGRKVALEEAVDLANNWAMAHVIEDNAKLTVGDYIAKELIK
jgi:hypothetical protein